jgi:diguanylate cyclase (GGDEF)-like protein
MSQVLDHLDQIARLTRGKDRDSIDTTLVEVLQSLLDARVVALSEALADDHGARWLTRARLERGMVAPQSTPPWLELADLPLVEQDPEGARALQQRQTRVVPQSTGHRVLVPVLTETERQLIVDVLLDQAPSAATVRMIEGFARIFENFVSLLDASERDTLTGLLNRKSFDDAFYKATRRELAEGVDEGGRRASALGGYWLAVVDVDHFKSVNDRYGHLIGDEVLLLMARILRSTFRHVDRLYRFGGEEFVVLMCANDAAAAAAAFERLRQNVERYAFPQVGRITVSIGYTQVREHDTPADAFERADRAVYLAKASGRNQVRSFELDVAPTDTAPTQRADSGGDVELF